jgi:hypothetical protein
MLDAVDFPTGKTTTTFKSDRFEPELCNVVVTFNVNMAWLVAIARVKTNRYGPTRKTVGIAS